MKLQRIVVTAAVACLAFGLAACGSDSDSDASSSTTTAQNAVCADTTALKSSVTDLTDLDLTSGRSEITAGLNKVEKNLDALGDSAQADLQPEIDDVKDALDELQSAVKNFGDGNLTDNLQDAGSAISNVGSAAGELLGSLDTQCKD
jgi:hypothetical protein